MILWFVGMSLVAVLLVFRSPAVDYRLVVLGALVPLVELPFGEPRLLHSLTGAVLALVLAMLATPRRRLVQRRLVGVPIGMFLHLVLDGMWAWSDTALPEVSRGWWNIGLELAGVTALWWFWQRFRLNEPDRRQRFWRTGRIDRDLMGL
jgi:membrane-bound metal-dependent hydrolase YbcI (DUF457 family)